MAQKCGCETEILYDEFNGDKVLITYCPMHEAAPNLVDALEACKAEIQDVLDENPNSIHLGKLIDQAEQALAEAGDVDGEDEIVRRFRSRLAQVGK